jgi:hypothetical protein
MLLPLGALLATVLTVAQSDTISRHDIVRDVERLVQSDTVPGPPGEGTVRVVGFKVDGAQKVRSLDGFLQQHGRLLWYLATHTPGAEARILPLSADPRPVRDSISAALINNDVFMRRLMTMLSQYGASRHRVVEGVPAMPERPSISAADLSVLGARFFYPDRFSADGQTMFSHICAGANGLGDVPMPVDPAVEAFLFVAVSDAAFAPNSELMADYEIAAKRAKVVSMSKDVTTRIRRAQGALWMQLEQSAALKRAIESGYAMNAAVLPFRISTIP